MSFQIESFISKGGPFNLKHTRIQLSNQYNRSTHPKIEIENQLEVIWQDKVKSNPRLFNATKFRFQGFQIDKETRFLNLNFGLTDYKTYLTTCCSNLTHQLIQDSVKSKKEEDPFCYLSRKVGVAAVVETSDQHIALIKRSQNVVVYQDLNDTPGGHPEPSKISLDFETLDSATKEELTRYEEASLKEFFDSIKEEVHEEINIEHEALSSPVLLGIVYQSAACTPSFSFYMKCQYSAKELLERYQAGPKDQFESIQVQVIPIEKFLFSEESNAAFLNQLTPSARGSLEIWKQTLII